MSLPERTRCYKPPLTRYRAIQNDFANGLQELDREAGEEKDRENFDPTIPVRDSDEVARSLPVFCVSSRGYQKVKGRLRKDGDHRSSKTQSRPACLPFKHTVLK